MRFASLSGPAIENLQAAVSKSTDSHTVQVEQVHGEERLSGPFQYTVQFQFVKKTDENNENASDGDQSSATSSGGGGPNFDEVVGRPVALSFNQSMAGGRRTGSRTVSGIVTKIRQHGKGVGSAALTTTSFLVEIRPALWRLHLSKSNRSFAERPIVKDQSAGDPEEGILNEMLGGHIAGTHLSDDYQKRKNVVQHNETDLEFVHRIAEEAGVVYYFDEDGQVVLVDNNDDAAYRPYRRFEATSNGQVEKRQDLKPAPKSSAGDEEGILRTYAFEQNLIPNLLSAQSYDYEKGGMSGKMTGSTSAAGGQETTGMVRETPGGLNWHVDKSPDEVWERGPNMQRRRIDQLQAAQKVLRGTTGSRLLSTGTRFQLQESTCGDVTSHFPSSNGAMKFVVARAVVHAEQGNVEVEFEAFPKQDDTKTTSPDYRGDRYAERGTGTGETENKDVDPYTLSTEPAVAKSTSKIQSGVYTAKVEEVPGGNTDKAKKGMVKVDLVSKNGGKPWARVVSFWAGGRHGAQYLPRKGDTVAVAHPGQDSNQDALVIGTLHDGTRTMPFSDEPKKKSGLRTHSRRETEGKDLYNEIAMSDEPKNEEVRIQAPMRRTDLTGLERNAGGSVSLYKFNGGEAPDGKNLGERDDFNPTAPRFVTEGEKMGSMSKKGDKVCTLKPLAIEIKVEYEGVEEKDIENKRIKVDDYPENKSTKFKLISDLDSDVKKELGKEVSLEEFMYDLTESKQGERKMSIEDEGDLWWYTVSNEEEIDEYISYEEYSDLGDTVKYTLYKGDGNTDEKSGKGNLVQDMQKTSEGTYESIEIKKGGAKPLYEVVGSREAYEVKAWGQDAYDVEPYRELYPTKEKIDKYKGEAAKRTEYTEGGAIDACQGSYRIHSFGDRLEIFKASQEENKGVFQQEVSEEWEVEDLPGEHDQFEDDDPIMILNKDGSIVIQSSEGINIESSEDINIQSGGSINMYAEENIEEEADEEISIVGKEIKIGTEEKTHSIEQRSMHHFRRHSGVVQKNSQEAMTIKNENIVLSTAYLHMALAKAVHLVGGPIGIKAVPLIDIVNTGVDFSISAIIKSKLFPAKESESVVKLKDDVTNLQNQLAYTNEVVADDHNRVLANEDKIMKSVEDIQTVQSRVLRDEELAMKIVTAALNMQE